MCQAHLLALEKLVNGSGSDAYNLGNGNGFSVQEVIDVAWSVTGRDIKVVDASRREGDPAMLVADAKRGREELGWLPEYEALENIIGHA